MDAIGDYDSDEEEIDEGDFYHVNVDQVDSMVEDASDPTHRDERTSRFATEEERVQTHEGCLYSEPKLRAAGGLAHSTDDKLRVTQGLGTKAVPSNRADQVAKEKHEVATGTSHPHASSQPAAFSPGKGDHFSATDAYPDTDDQFPATDAYPDTDDQFPATDAYPNADGQFSAAIAHPDADNQLPATDTYPDTDDQFPAADQYPDTREQFSATGAYPNTDMQFALTQNTGSFQSDSEMQLAAKSTVHPHLGAKYKAMRSYPHTDDEIGATGAYPQPNDQHVDKHTAATNTVSSNAAEELGATQKVAPGAYRDLREKVESAHSSAVEASCVDHPTKVTRVSGDQLPALGATVKETSVKTAEPFGATHLAAAEATGTYPDTDHQFAVTHWREYLDPESKCTYFYNEAAGVSTWDEPTSYMPVDEPPVVPDGWLATLDPDSGCYYYYNIESQRSCWEQPADVYTNLEPEVADRLRSLRGESRVSPKQLPQIDLMDVSAPRYSGAVARGPPPTQSRDIQQGSAQRVGAAEAARRALAQAAAPSGTL